MSFAASDGVLSWSISLRGELDGRILIIGADAGMAVFPASVVRLIFATRKPLIS